MFSQLLSSPSQTSVASTAQQPLLERNTAAPRNVQVDASVASYLHLSTGGNAMSSGGTPLSGPKTSPKLTTSSSKASKEPKSASPKSSKSASPKSSPGSSKGQETFGSFFKGF